jgi:hypothetical protein
MTNISDRGVWSSQLTWGQPTALARMYELKTDDEVAGTLEFHNVSGSLATARVGTRCWTFKRVGFFQSRVVVRACGASPDVAVFRPQTWLGGGTLETTDGKRILVDTSFWKSVMRFTLDSGETLATLATSGVFHLTGTVQINSGSTELEQLPLLLSLGWYLVVMMHSDMAESAAIIG